MGILSFLSRRAALPPVTTAEVDALRTRLATMSALLDDVGAELVRMRRREEAQNARFEQLTVRVDFLARQVRELAAASKDCDVGRALCVSRDVEKFFVSDRAGPRT